MAERPLPFDEWQVVYRQTLQLDRALTGRPPLVEQALGQESAAAVIAPPRADSAYWLPTRVLLRRILDAGSRLLQTQVELARTEVRADLAAEPGWPSCSPAPGWAPCSA